MSLRVLILATFICTATAYTQEATLILQHGKIVTADPQFRVVESIAIRGDRIVGIGAHEEVARLAGPNRSEEHTSELQSRLHLVCRLLLEKKKTAQNEEAIGS